MKSNNFSIRFVEGILGKKHEAEEVKIPPVQEMLQNLIGIDDEVWGEYGFRREPLRGKFSEEERAILIHKANECGKKCARSIRKQYGQVNVYTLAEKLGLEVDYPERPNGGGHIIFAQFVEPNRVTVFKDSVNKAAQLVEEEKLSEIFAHINIEEILLAHEIFHFIEEKDKEIFTRTETIRLWKVGPIKNDSIIVCLGEIAGMAFAKELLQMSYSPYILDSFLVYLYHPQAAYGLYEEVMGIKASVSKSLLG